MGNLTHIGMDVHKESTAVAILRPGELEPDQRVIPTTPEAYRKLINRIGTRDLIVCYEAGPSGYHPYRILSNLGVACEVIAPSLIPRRAGKRVKTDRLDARNLARLHRAGELTAIRIPTPEQEAIRELVRVRADLKEEQRRTVQRIKAFLLRSGIRFPSRKGFNAVHQNWARGLRFEHLHSQAAFDHLLSSFETRKVQISSLDDQLDQLATEPCLAEPVARLRCFKGIDTLSAITIAAEVPDFRMFPSAPDFMGFTGLVPSEDSTGESIQRGSITKAGNAHLRRILVEASWAYRYRPAIGVVLQRRQKGQPPEVLAHCWAAQVRLHSRYVKLTAIKNKNVAVIAVARELAGFIWGLMNKRYAA